MLRAVGKFDAVQVAHGKSIYLFAILPPIMLVGFH